MATLYVSEPGSVAHKIDERVVVTVQDRVLADIPLVKIEQVRVIGRGVTLTTALMMYLLDYGIDTVFLSGAQRYRGRLLGPESGHGALRTLQVRAAENDDRALALARAVVRGKLVNQRFLLRRHGATTAGVSEPMAGIRTMLGRIDSAPSLDALRGVEGQAAALYFAGLRHLLRRDFGFKRRVQHPPTDPVNALLSFGYTLLLNDVISAVRVVGLDPYIGFFHALRHNRPSLALDLMEEFRPVIVDTLVLGVINGAAVALSDFRVGEAPERPVLLGERLRNLVLAQYGARLETQVRDAASGERTTYRRLLELQARALAHALDGSVPYRAFAAQ